MKMKVIGGKNLPSYWERFNRLQRTVDKLGGLAMYPRGVFRFSSFEELEQWKMDLRLNHPGPPKKSTSSPSVDP